MPICWRATDLLVEKKEGNHHDENCVKADKRVSNASGKFFQCLNVSNRGQEKGQAVGKADQQEEGKDRELKHPAGKRPRH